MKDRTKEVIKDGFGSLVNNAAVIRGAKNGPLWLTIVMFVLSIIVAIIPNFVSQVRTNGSSFLNSAAYKLDEHITSIALDLDKSNHKIAISEDHELTLKKNGNPVDLSTYGSAKPYVYYENYNTKKYEFVVYFTNSTERKDRTEDINAIREQYFVTTMTEGEKDEEGNKISPDVYTTTPATAETENAYHPSFIVFSKNAIFVEIYSTYTNAIINRSAIGDFKTIKATDNLLKDLLTVKVKDQEGNEVEITDKTMSNSKFISGVYNNFKVVLNKSYETVKVSNTWTTTGLYAGIFFGLTLLMGFVVWILTRGKNNPNNYFSVWLCYKIQARLSLAPAIIAMIVGFFFSQSPVIYIAVIGLRVMWMSMKDLRPMPQA